MRQKISLIGRVFLKKCQVGKQVGGIVKEKGRGQVTTSTRCSVCARWSHSLLTVRKHTPKTHS